MAFAHPVRAFVILHRQWSVGCLCLSSDSRIPKEMDLDWLSNEILHHIFLRLPFKDRIRVARVNRNFNELSKVVISQTKTFHLTAPIFERIPCESMKELINSCADHLEKIIYKTTSFDLDDQEYTSVIRERLRFVLSVSFPHLSIVSVDSCVRDFDWRLCELFRQFFINHPNIRVMEWEDHTLHHLMMEVDFFVFENLERIEVEYYDSQLFSKLKNYCPNLKHLVFKSTIHGSSYVGLKWILDVVRVWWPLLETLEIQWRVGFNVDITNSGVFSSFRRLILGFDCKISDETFQVISESFPKLAHLELYVHTFQCDEGELITANGMAYLESMNHLRHVKVRFQSFRPYLITTAQQLMRCKCLHVAEFDGAELPSRIVLGLTRSCPNLRRLIIEGICGINTPDSANDFVSSVLDGFTQKKLSIVIRSGDSNVWMCSKVKSQIKKINTTGRWLSIEVSPYKVTRGVNEWGYGLVVHWHHPSPQPSVPWYRKLISLCGCQRRSETDD